jgi:hypothetical protein
MTRAWHRPLEANATPSVVGSARRDQLRSFRNGIDALPSRAVRGRKELSGSMLVRQALSSLLTAHCELAGRSPP